LNPVSNLHVEQIIQRCKAVLVEQYGKQLKGVILFGSTARGDSREDSDIDLLVLLEQPFDFFVELRRLVDMLYPIQLESDKLISAKPVSAEDFEKGTLSLYRIARREGVFIK
jgi:uncharacterized protein